MLVLLGRRGKMGIITLKDVNGVKVVRKNVEMVNFPVLEGKVVRFVDSGTGEEVGLFFSINMEG